MLIAMVALVFLVISIFALGWWFGRIHYAVAYLLLFPLAPSQAQDPVPNSLTPAVRPAPNGIWISNESLTTTAIVTVHPTSNISISCGHGSVEISTKDGTVVFKGDCEPDEAARRFWAAVTVTFPKSK